MNERVESRHFPYLHLGIAFRGRTVEAEALIDTGFDGDVALPAPFVGEVGPPDIEARAWLADGSPIALGDEPAVGRGITDRFRLILDHRQQVIVEP